MKGLALPVALAVALYSSAPAHARAHPQRPFRFSHVGADIPHHVHRPELFAFPFEAHPDENASSSPGTQVFFDARGLRVRVEVEEGRSAVITANVNRGLVPGSYREMVRHGNGTVSALTVDEAGINRGCYWHGTAEFSDGGSGAVAFTTCGRSGSWSGAALNGVGRALHGKRQSTEHERQSAEHGGRASGDRVELRFLRGLIVDRHRGVQYGIEPVDHEAAHSPVLQEHVRRVNFDDGLDMGKSVASPFSEVPQRFLSSSSSKITEPQHFGDHYVYPIHDLAEQMGIDRHCATTDAHDHRPAHPPQEHVNLSASYAANLETEELHTQSDAVGESPSGQLRGAGAASRRNLAVQPELWVELYIINDALRYAALGDSTTDDALEIANNCGALYGDAGVDDGLAARINIAVVAMLTITEGTDPWDADFNNGCTNCQHVDEADVGKLLEAVDTWRLQAPEVTTVPHDNLQMLSYRDFESSTVGLAWVGTMCNRGYSSGVVQTTAGSALSATTLAHEMGHNFGSAHDSTNNDCPASGFIMAAMASSTLSTSFSSCSVAYINNFLPLVPDACLNNEPDTVFGGQLCGDGMATGSEECDCGAADCSAAGDPCCDGATCMYAAGAECSPVHDACCTETCGVRSAADAFRCRTTPTAGVDAACDAAEYCDGTSKECPPDKHLRNGGQCVDDAHGESGKCFEGACVSRAATCEDIERDYGLPLTTCPFAYAIDDCGHAQVSHNLFCFDESREACYYGYSSLDSTTGQLSEVLVPDGSDCKRQGGTRGQCFNKTCLAADDEVLYPGAVCGDGFVDEAAGEQCDCGANSCRTTDPCCNGATCRFVSGATCSPATSGCCLPTCTPVPAWYGRQCREADSSAGGCDTPEYCSGLSSTCPPDVFLAAGVACASQTGNIGTCYEGACVSAQDFADDELASASGIQFTIPIAFPSSNPCAAMNSACNAVHGQYTDGRCYAFGGMTWGDGYACSVTVNAREVQGACVGSTCVPLDDLRPSSVCGDGITEDGEECDCGAGYCGALPGSNNSLSANSCCNGASCVVDELGGASGASVVGSAAALLALPVGHAAAASCQTSYLHRRCSNSTASVMADVESAAACAALAVDASAPLFQYSEPLTRCELLMSPVACNDESVQVTPEPEGWAVFIPCACPCSNQSAPGAGAWMHTGLCQAGCDSAGIVAAAVESACAATTTSEQKITTTTTTTTATTTSASRSTSTPRPRSVATTRAAPITRNTKPGEGVNVTKSLTTRMHEAKTSAGGMTSASPVTGVTTASPVTTRIRDTTSLTTTTTATEPVPVWTFARTTTTTANESVGDITAPAPAPHFGIRLPLPPTTTTTRRIRVGDDDDDDDESEDDESGGDDDYLCERWRICFLEAAAAPGINLVAGTVALLVAALL
eukprot:INCI18673.1.p1 GENE.INCI18673.1~~INCI18673.1.p1  ORF type:complete len:1402 (-),score=184.55 INCI18673.1:3317-7522(-)